MPDHFLSVLAGQECVNVI